jgi:hypothetical protein
MLNAPWLSSLWLAAVLAGGPGQGVDPREVRRQTRVPAHAQGARVP